jgi:hypothetical protein
MKAFFPPSNPARLPDAEIGIDKNIDKLIFEERIKFPLDSIQYASK